MANLITSNIVSFKNVSGWNNGPLKPTVEVQDTGLANQVIAAAYQEMQDQLPNMSKGESLTIIFTIGDET